MIYFMLPDIRNPQGGGRLIYETVDELNSMGFDAAVWHGSANFRYQWFSNTTRVSGSPTLRLNVGDLLVVPEIWLSLDQYEKLAAANIVVINMNHFNTFKGAGYKDAWLGNYPGWPNAVAAIAISKAIRDFLLKAHRDTLPIHYFPMYMNAEMFVPGPKEKIIATMPRKRRADMETVIQLLYRSKHLKGWTFDIIDNVSYSDWAERVSRAAVFLSASDREGCAYPPAEAMAAGAYVVGFTGDGCKEYMNPDFCSVIPDQDLLQFAMETERTVIQWESDRSVIDVKTRAARQYIADHYSRGEMRRQLKSVFVALTEESSAARQSKSVVVRHYTHEARPVVALLRRIALDWTPPIAKSIRKTHWGRSAP